MVGRARTLPPVELVITAAAMALALTWLGAALLVGRSRRAQRRAQATADQLARHLAAETSRASTLAASEREAAWSARRLASLAEDRQTALTAAASRLEEGERAARGVERALDAVADELRATTGELEATRRELDAASVRVASLEAAELAAPQAADELETAGRVASLEREIAAARRSVAAHATEARELRHRLAVAERVAAAEAPERAPAGLDPRRGVAELERALDAAEQRLAEAAEQETTIAALNREIARLGAALAAARPSADEVADPSPDETIGLRARLAAAERDLAETRDRLDAARREIGLLHSAAEHARDDADRRVAAAGARISDLEGAARAGDREAAALTAHQARIADLEQRLAALHSARTAELRRLTEKISSMERLYIDVEVRDRRIGLLEEELKDAAEARDHALGELVRAERSAADLRTAHTEASRNLERFAGMETDLLATRARIVELEAQLSGDVLGAEVERLRRALDAERVRADRATQRSALAEDPPSGYAEWDRRLRDRVADAVASAVGPLQDRLAHLHQVILEKEARIAALSATAQASPGGPDDLTLIKGIGPKIAAILHGLGITTFRDIAEFTDDDVRRVGEHLPVYGGRIADDHWIEQARAFAG